MNKTRLWILIVAGVLFVGAFWVYYSGKLDFLFNRSQTMENIKIKAGDTITVDYVGKHLDGTVFDTSLETVAQEAGLYNPNRDYTQGLSFTVGAGQMIKGFDDGVIGMQVGETKTVEIPAENAYGARSDEMIVRIPLAEAGDVSQAQVGMKVVLGGMYPATVTEITDTEIVFDANHELAGKDLVFDITIKAINTDLKL